MRDVTVRFFRLGLTAFGGPAAHIAMFRDEVVIRCGWVCDAEFFSAYRRLSGGCHTRRSLVAASLGLMAAVTVELGRNAVIDPVTGLIALAAAVLLIRYRVNSTWLIVGGAVAGWALSWLQATF